MEACRNKEVENLYQSVYASSMKFESYAVKCTAIDKLLLLYRTYDSAWRTDVRNLPFDPAWKRINLNLQFFIFES